MKIGYTFTDLPEFHKDNTIRFLKCSSFLIVHKKYGPIIFDTGSFYDIKTLMFFLKNYFNLYPEDVKWVFISHIHPDHIGANRIFTKANIVMSKREYQFGTGIAEIAFKNGDLLAYLHEKCPGYKKTFDQFEADNMKRYLLESWSDENLGLKLNPKFIEDNPEIPDFIETVFTPGHTFYHYSFLIKSEHLNILYTGDALSMRMILRDDIENRFLEPHVDYKLYFESLEKLKNFDGLIAPGHDRPFFIKNLKSLRSHYYNLEDVKNKFLNVN